jgi:hypothetical protein
VSGASSFTISQAGPLRPASEAVAPLSYPVRLLDPKWKLGVAALAPEAGANADSILARSRGCDKSVRYADELATRVIRVVPEQTSAIVDSYDAVAGGQDGS